MTPEIKLAQMLSGDRESEKLAADMSSKSKEELIELLKESTIAPAAPSPVAAGAKLPVSKLRGRVSQQMKTAADEWGRDLAQRDFALAKIAVSFRDVKSGAKAAGSAAYAYNSFKGHAARAWEFGKDQARQGAKAWKRATPGQRAAVGGAAGALAGAAASGSTDEYGNKKSRLPGALAGAALGAGAGALSHQGVRQNISARMKGLHKIKSEPKSKTAATMNFASAKGVGQKLIGTLAHKAAVNPMSKNIAIGAGVGAAGGAVRHFGKKPQQRGSLLGSMAGGAALGAGGGAAAGAAARKVLTNPGKVGNFVRAGTPFGQANKMPARKALPANTRAAGQTVTVK